MSELSIGCMLHNEFHRFVPLTVIDMKTFRWYLSTCQQQPSVYTSGKTLSFHIGQ